MRPAAGLAGVYDLPRQLTRNPTNCPSRASHWIPKNIKTLSGWNMTPQPRLPKAKRSQDARHEG